MNRDDDYSDTHRVNPTSSTARHRSKQLQTSSFIHTPVWVIPVVIFAFLCATAAAEDSSSSSYREDDDNGMIYPEESSPACVVVFSLLFGFFIILFCAVLGYFSFMEDSLMRRYIKEGELIKGDVMKADFARGGGQVGACSNKRTIAEYIIFVEYSRELSADYEVRIRKQMKVLETDFSRRLVPGSSAMLQSLKSQEEGDKKANEVETEEILCCGYVDIESVQQSKAFACTKTIELYVLQEFPTSGLPRRQVERSCSYRHRLATFALIVVVLTLAGLCTRVAAATLVDMTDARENAIDLYSILLLAALILAQVPLVHYCMRNLFWSILLKEYLESGDYVTIHRDDSTLSATASDISLKSPCTSASVGLDITESGA